MNDNVHMTLGDASKSYILELTLRGCSPATIRMARAVERHLERFFANRKGKPAETLHAIDFEAFRGALLRCGLKASRVNHLFTYVRPMLRDLRPDLRMPRRLAVFPERRPIPGPDALEAVHGHLGSPFLEMARLGMLTLMSLSEIVRLQRPDYLRTEGILGVRKQTARGSGVEAVILSAGAQCLLDRQLDSHQSSWVFPGPQGRPYSTGHVARQWRKAVQAAGIPVFPFGDRRRWGIMALYGSGERFSVVAGVARSRCDRTPWRWTSEAVTDTDLRRAVEKLSTMSWSPNLTRAVRGRRG